MPKKTKAHLITEFLHTEEGLHKINTIKSGLLSDSIENFPQIFATLAKSNLQGILGTSFYAFEKKIADPGKFTLNEIDTMANLFHVDFDHMFKFVRKTMLMAHKHNKTKRKK